MFSIANFLDDVKARAGIESDYRLAKVIEITHSAIIAFCRPWHHSHCFLIQAFTLGSWETISAASKAPPITVRASRDSSGRLGAHFFTVPAPVPSIGPHACPGPPASMPA